MRDRQREETRRKLYQAALQIFTRDGVAQCRIEDIAQIAQVSRAAFYFHFPSKDDVLLELLKEAEDPVFEPLDALPAGATLAQVLDTTIEGLANYWGANDRQKLLIDVFSVAIRRTSVIHDREAEIVRATLSRRFVTAAEKNELSPALPAEVLADYYLLSCFATMASWSAQPIMPLIDMLRGVTHLFLNGAKP